MKKEFIVINSECDNLPLSTSIFIPDSEINGIIQIAHGMCEHKERYYGFMEYLTGYGYVTVIHDHRGHGASVKDKTDLGYFYENKADFVTEDLYQVTKYIKNRFQNKKLTLLGHSMGSMIVRKYIKKYDLDIDKLIVCGSPSKNNLVDVGLFITKIIKFFRGEKYRSRLIQFLTFGNCVQKSHNLANPEHAWICSNEETLSKYSEDELCGFVFTTNGFENLFNLMKDIYDKKGWILKNKNLPIFFIAGEDDPIIINKKKWLKSQEFLKKLGYLNITCKLYPKLRHEILNEKNNLNIYEDILDFVKK